MILNARIEESLKVNSRTANWLQIVLHLHQRANETSKLSFLLFVCTLLIRIVWN